MEADQAFAGLAEPAQHMMLISAPISLPPCPSAGENCINSGCWRCAEAQGRFGFGWAGLQAGRGNAVAARVKGAGLQ